jgi:hypothetical protein
VLVTVKDITVEPEVRSAWMIAPARSGTAHTTWLTLTGPVMLGDPDRVSVEVGAQLGDGEARVLPPHPTSVNARPATLSEARAEGNADWRGPDSPGRLDRLMLPPLADSTSPCPHPDRSVRNNGGQ